MLRSRAQRGVSKHEGHRKSATANPASVAAPAFETAASPPPQAEGGTEIAPRHALGGDPSALPRYSYSPCQTAQSSSFPRRVAAPGFCFFSFPSTPMRGERSAERRKSSVAARFGARRSTPSEAWRASSGTRSPLGAPPWRFWAGGRASFSGISSGSVQRTPRSQVLVPGGRGPEPPGADGYEPRPQDATPRSAFGSSPETAPQIERGYAIRSIGSYSSQ